LISTDTTTIPALPTIPNSPTRDRPPPKRWSLSAPSPRRAATANSGYGPGWDQACRCVARPQSVHAILHSLTNAQTSIQRPRDADDDPNRRTAQTLGVPELRTNNRELGEGRLQNLLLQPWMTHQHDA